MRPTCVNISVAISFSAVPSAPALKFGVHLSKVVQLRAAIARHDSAVPTHLDLMGSDSGDRAQSGKLVAVLADPVERAPNDSLQATAVFMMIPRTHGRRKGV
jgi:hypothetical protein